MLPLVNQCWEEVGGREKRGSEREKRRPAIKLIAFQKEAHGTLGQKLDGTFLLFRDEGFHPSKDIFYWLKILSLKKHHKIQ